MASKTIKINGTFQVYNAAATIEAQKVLNDTLLVSEVTQHFPMVISGNAIDQQVSFGGVALAKRVFLRTNFPVSIKFNSVVAPAFSFGPGDGILMSENGITALYVTAGPNNTELEAIIAGD
ncbi:MAG: hypothetical protein AB7L09_00255 [Nitrospira sp.]